MKQKKTKKNITSKLEIKNFEDRKKEHISITLNSESQFQSENPLNKIKLKHTAFPELNFSEVLTATKFDHFKLHSPIFISSMTAGHENSEFINSNLAKLSEKKQILMGVGSQRKELFDLAAREEWKKIKKKYPGSLLLSNIGLSQLISTPVQKVQELVDSLGAVGIFIHTNPLQECIQKEGTPNFKGGLLAIENIVNKLKIPVIVKEVGNGFSQENIRDLKKTGIYALDLAGVGGTDWSKVEALRYSEASLFRDTGFVFSQWGYTLPEMIRFSEAELVSYQIWASGGIRNGLDGAKMMAMGCSFFGLAQPWIKAMNLQKKNAKLGSKNISKNSISESETYKNIEDFYDKLHRELKIAMFCCGVKSTEQWKKKKVYYVDL